MSEEARRGAEAAEVGELVRILRADREEHVAADVLGSRACDTTELQVLPPQQSAAAMTALVESRLGTLEEDLQAGMGVGLQAISFISSALNGADGSEEGAQPPGGRRLSLQEGGMRERVVTMLSGMTPEAEDAASSKLQYTHTTAAALSNSSELSDAGKGVALDSMETVAGGLSAEDVDAQVGAQLALGLGSLLQADESERPALPPPPPDAPPAPPLPPPGQGDYGASSLVSSLRGSFSTYVNALPSALLDEATAASPTEQPEELRGLRIRRLVQNIANRTVRNLVADEGQISIVAEQGGSASDAPRIGVRRAGSANPRDVELMAENDARATITAPAVSQIFTTSLLTDELATVVELYRSSALPITRPPPLDRRLATPRLASDMLSVSVSAAETGKRVQASYDRTVGLLSRRRLQEASGEVDSSLAAVSAQQGVDASGQPVTQVWLPWQPGPTSGCRFDYMCRGPKGHRVDGRCVDGRCVCPPPWTGPKCGMLSVCIWAEVGNNLQPQWQSHRSSCVLDLSASERDSGVASCVCPVVGSFDVVLVETPLLAAAVAFLKFNIVLASLDFLFDTVMKNPILALCVLGVDVLWIVGVVIAIRRSNLKTARSEYYQFWRSQHN